MERLNLLLYKIMRAVRLVLAIVCMRQLGEGGLVGGVLLLRIFIRIALWSGGGWLGLVFFLVYVGALLILFFYVCALSFNPEGGVRGYRVVLGMVWGGLVGGVGEYRNIFDTRLNLLSGVGGVGLLVRALTAGLWAISKISGQLTGPYRPYF